MKHMKFSQIKIRAVEAFLHKLRPSDQLKTKYEKTYQEIGVGPITKSLIGILPKDASIEDYKKHIDTKFD